VKFPRFLKLQKRRNIECACWIDNHDALAFLERFRKSDPIDRCADKYCGCGEEPEFGETIFVHEDANRVCASVPNAWRLMGGRRFAEV
jgi:hypothetical protein